MKVHIAKTNGILYSGEIDSLTAPTATGILTILPNHMPLVTVLREGRLVVRKDDEEVFVHDVKTGVLEITGESATILI
jgi:F-type H+-transporting ATPase subunit epsilon